MSTQPDALTAVNTAGLLAEYESWANGELSELHLWQHVPDAQVLRIVATLAAVNQERDRALAERDALRAEVERYKRGIDESLRRGAEIKRLCDRVYALTIYGDPPPLDTDTEADKEAQQARRAAWIQYLDDLAAKGE